MRRAALVVLVLLLFYFFIPSIKPAFGAELEQTLIRLSRQVVSTSVGGMVCATTPSSDNGVENTVQVIFPSGFTVNSTSSNWTVDTADLLQGATAWPGIGTATSINGQIVTFPSSNLSPNTLYCFNFADTGTITTPSGLGSYSGSLRTRNSSNNTIDSLDFGIPITSNDGITVTATAPANPTDFEADLELQSPANGTIASDTELTYRLSYKSNLSYPVPITVEAQWNLGTIQGNSTPTEDILDYIVGSASNGYGNTNPVIDLIGRKISWSISSIPSSTTQTVTFKLRTNASYKSTSPVSFQVNGRVVAISTQTADSTVTSNYYNSQYITPTPTPTCVPSSCPTPTPQRPTSTPTPAPLITPVIYSVDIRTITHENAVIFTAANKSVTVRIQYGTSPDALNLVKTSPYSQQHLIELTSLKPHSRYYFRVIVTDSTGRQSRSDIYSLDTATEADAIDVITNSLIVTSGDVLLTNTFTPGELPNVIVPLNSPYSFRFALTPYKNIKDVRTIIRSSNVLGVNTQSYTEPNSVFITEISPGNYIGKLDPNLSSGSYNLILQVQDYEGNLREMSLANLFIVKPMTVVNASTKTGIENAKVTLSYYNERLRKYEPLSTSLTSIINPARSDAFGVLDVVLPEGKYRAEINVLGFKSKVVEFTIGPSSSNYPVIELLPLPFSIGNYVSYSLSNIMDVFDVFRNFVDNLKSSQRYLELLTLGTILFFVGLSVAKLSKMFGVSPLILPFFAAYHTVSFIYKPKHTYFVQGKVAEVVTNEPLPGVLIYFSHTNGKVMSHVRTNENGEFTAALKDSSNIKISLSKKGYTPFSKIMKKEDLGTKLNIAMNRFERPSRWGLQAFVWYLEALLGSVFAAILVGTIIIEVFFATQFGLWKVLPCIVISVANLLLWAIQTKPRY